MRILIVSNFYPPECIGGYELGCRDVVELLRARGHDVTVLTSTYGRSRPLREQDVRRELRWEPLGPGWMPNRVAAKPGVFAHNYARTCSVIAELHPEVVHVWNPANISLAPAFAAQDCAVPIAFFVSDHWIMNWERWPHPKLRALGQRILVRILGTRSIESLDLSHSHFVSRYMRDHTADSGRTSAKAGVISWGVDPDAFPFAARERHGPLRLLYAGQIAPHKGVHTAIEAVAILRDRHGLLAELSVAGGSVYPSYARGLQQLVRAHRLENGVRMLGSIERRNLTALYHAHDVFLLPSTWPEPFSLALLEAMAAGTPVVGTATGGSGEVLQDGVTGLTFAAGDAADCARAVQRLAAEPQMASRLAAQAHEQILQSFTLARMIDRVEVALAQAATQRKNGLRPA